MTLPVISAVISVLLLKLFFNILNNFLSKFFIIEQIICVQSRMVTQIIDPAKIKMPFSQKTEKGIKTPVLNNKGATSHRSQEYYFIKTGSSSGSDSTPSLHLPKVILSGICSRLIFTAAGPHRLIPISLLSLRTCFYIQLLKCSTTYLLTYMI